MKALAVLASAILAAVLLSAALPAIAALSPENMQDERRLESFMSIKESLLHPPSSNTGSALLSCRRQ
ncbi:hypothetical protein [Indiicoccus explosivorum]|uniref:hypothetical protein n=1 Tax=Indiicoccus explosivorum TaxID=1917864 RepID=UPI000B43C765|nr:hypothetical protein [Indiicoccus explosivorum]